MSSATSSSTTSTSSTESPRTATAGGRAEQGPRALRPEAPEAGMDSDRSALFLFGEAMAYSYAAALRAAAVLRVADRMGDQPRGVADLAAETGCAATALRRVLRTLAARGIVAA